MPCAMSQIAAGLALKSRSADAPLSSQVMMIGLIPVCDKKAVASTCPNDTNKVNIYIYIYI